MLESLEGKKGFPRFKPPFPANYGLYGKPTTINNTETFAAVPWIIHNGGEWFLNLGLPNNGGTKIFSICGDVARPGNYEIRLGTPFEQLLALQGIFDQYLAQHLEACESSLVLFFRIQRQHLDLVEIGLPVIIGEAPALEPDARLIARFDIGPGTHARLPIHFAVGRRHDRNMEVIGDERKIGIAIR